MQELLGRVEAVGYTESDEDVQIVSELMDDIRDTVTDYQVSSNLKPFLQSHLGDRSRRHNSRPYTIRISNSS